MYLVEAIGLGLEGSPVVIPSFTNFWNRMNTWCETGDGPNKEKNKNKNPPIITF